MLKFPSIEQFRNVKRSVEMKAQYVGTDPTTGDILVNRDAVLPVLFYEGTIKLHGTNAAVILNREGKIVSCQSRERIITPQDDNAGFAKFIHALPPEVLMNLRLDFDTTGDVAIYGEWAGKGVQQGVAISQLDKFFCIFAARKVVEDENDEQWLDIHKMLDYSDSRIFNIKKFKTFILNINFQNPGEMVNQMNAWTLEVENECPFGKHFGISSTSEAKNEASPLENLKSFLNCYKELSYLFRFRVL